MIVFQLKDKERQAALEKALPEFNKWLQSACRTQFDCDFDAIQVIDEGNKDWLVKIPKHDIETFNTYDPNGWNQFPDVTPPEGILMRVEFVFEGIMRRNCAVFENGAWRITENGKASYNVTLDGVKRFRPWE